MPPRARSPRSTSKGAGVAHNKGDDVTRRSEQIGASKMDLPPKYEHLFPQQSRSLPAGQMNLSNSSTLPGV